MRDVTSRLRQLETRLRESWPKPDDEDSPDERSDWASPDEIVRFELGLMLLEEVIPKEASTALWAILSGHEPLDTTLTPAQRRQVERARQYLLSFRSPAYARQVEGKYWRVPERFRLFEPVKEGGFRRKPFSICPERLAIYEDLLASPVPYRSRPVRFAGEGVYRFRYRGRFDSVRFTADVVLPPPAQHPSLASVNRSVHPPVVVPWDELRETARWMDAEEEARGLSSPERGGWEKRFLRVELDHWDAARCRYVRSNALTLNGLFHLAGMVSSGKSTMMDILSVWAVRKGLRVTVVVGDVVGVLNRARLFLRLGIAVAPILGGYNRMQHIARLHGAAIMENDNETPLVQAPHEGFRWISTGCPLDARRENRESGKPLAVEETPCTRLEPFDGTEREATDDEIPATPDRERHTCPLYAACPRH